MRIALLLTCLLNILATESKAQDVLENNITAELGYRQGAIHLGATYVRGADPIRWGGYLFYQSENKVADAIRANQLISIGAMSKFFILNTPKGVAYIGPGIGMSEIRNFHDIYAGNPNRFDKLFFGTIFKIGGQLSLTPKMKMGLEYMKISDWCQAEIIDSLTEYSSLTMAFEF